MKRRLFNALLSVLALSTVFTASAVTAKKGVVTVTQRDGTELNVRLYGDEWTHYCTTEDGYLLMEQDGLYYYGERSAATGQVVSSQRRAVNVASRTAADRSFLATLDPQSLISARVEQMAQPAAQGAPRFRATAGPGTFPGTSFPPLGEQKALVILVAYSNVDFTLEDPHDYFTRMLNEEGFNTNGGTGSCRDFYMQSSNNQFIPEFDVYGPVTLPKARSYYGSNDWYGNDQHPEEMVIDACDLLDDQIDFSEYDRDGDGYVDNVYIFYAGRGEADGGASETVWPHSWNVEYGVGYNPEYDGVKISRYGCSNEWSGTTYSGHADGIGTFCHEFGHVMGLPDLYATSYTGAFTPDAYACMDAGSYNNDGRTPPIMGVFERYALGWIEPTVIDGRMNCKLNHILTHNEAYIIPTSDPYEFFLLENRQLAGFDAYIPGHGMLIWHVDYDENVWTNNTVNNSTSHQYVDIEEADGIQSESTRSGDPFPGTANITSFTDDTTPSMKTWAKKGLNLPITEIKETNGVITFVVCGGLVDVDAPVLSEEITDIQAESFTASWSEVTDATNYVATLEQLVDADTWTVVPAYDRKDVGKVTTYTFTGLESLTTYRLTMMAENNGSFSEPSNSVTVTTAQQSFDRRRVILDEPADLSANSFTACWLPLDDATTYFVNVYEKTVENPSTDVCDFTGGISAMPTGWTTDSRSTYGNAAYSGAATPALKLSSDGQSIMSPLFDADILSFSFWHRGASSSAENTFSVYVLVNGAWALLEESDINNVSGGEVNSYEDLFPGVRQVKIVFNKAASGNLAIDDLTIEWGGDITTTPVNDYVDAPVDAAGPCSLSVQGLKGETRYYYTVHATDGTLTSLPSFEGVVYTLPTTGVSPLDIVSPNAITVDRRTVTVTAAPGTPITVTDIAGRTILAPRTVGTLTRFELPSQGVYIVRAGTAAVKVVVK